MTDIPAASRDRLAGELLPPLLTPVRELACDGGATRKTLWRLHDGALVESVLMGYPDRVTVCVSQPGRLRHGLPVLRHRPGRAHPQPVHRGDRRPGGLVRRAWPPAARCPAAPARLSHVVFMGMGEPLANYHRVIDAVRRLTAPAPEGLGLSQRHITVSTVGLVPAMRRLAEEDLAVTLALSLHAPDDDLRDELVPVNQRWKVAEVLEAAWDYAARTGRRVSIEYALIRDVNDQPWRADLLGRLLAGKLAHVNLIPLNPTPGSRWDASPKPVEREFVRRLRAAGVADYGTGHPGTGDRRRVRTTRGDSEDQRWHAADSGSWVAGSRRRGRRGGTVTSQGQRFRRRALRRGYKVDEVDAFLDRVEATLAGDPIGAPVAAQEVHDVVFRVRFGGYDEWQVDLHLDRVERQLADLEERGRIVPRRGAPGGAPAPCVPDRPRTASPTSATPPSRLGALDPRADAGQRARRRPAGRWCRRARRMPAPTMVRPPMARPPCVGAAAHAADVRRRRLRPMSAPPMRPDVRPADGRRRPALRRRTADWVRRAGGAGTTSRRPRGRPRPSRPASASPALRRACRYEEPECTTAGRRRPGFGRPARRMDMTHEMRFAGRTCPPPAVRPARRAAAHRRDAAHLHRAPVRQRLRRDPGQPALRRDHRALSGRSGMPLSEAELDPNQFSLVPGGYFEAEVNQALREVRDLVRR